jgi:hypothetical protein
LFFSLGRLLLAERRLIPERYGLARGLRFVRGGLATEDGGARQKNESQKKACRLHGRIPPAGQIFFGAPPLQTGAP